MKKERTGPRTDPSRTPRRTQKERLVISKNHASAPVTVRRERLSLTSKRGGRQPKFINEIERHARDSRKPWRSR